MSRGRPPSRPSWGNPGIHLCLHASMGSCGGVGELLVFKRKADVRDYIHNFRSKEEALWE